MGAAQAIRSPTPARSLGDLLGCAWQIGYVTSDLDRARDALSARCGLHDFIELPSRDAQYYADENPIDPWLAHFAVAARGDLIIELIEPVAGDVDFYRRALPADGSFGIALHHVAVAAPEGDAEWERLHTLAGASGLAFDRTVVIADRIRATYVDSTSLLGHMIEICQLAGSTRAFYLELLGADRQDQAG